MVLTVLLGACSHHQLDEATGGDDAVNVLPKNYKAEIVSAMHAYLNDPTGIRDAAIGAPVLKSTGNGGPTRYIVCVKFNPKKNAKDYSGVKEVAATFIAGRFDRFIETPREQCAETAYTPFPELQKLPP
ncbi:MAG TPA: hypothetical protein VH206_12335 [Xanthobacteraceae bacterium]|nr:hypothetical protein [Xanthobacteraceae bacterium]